MSLFDFFLGFEGGIVEMGWVEGDFWCLFGERVEVCLMDLEFVVIIDLFEGWDICVEVVLDDDVNGFGVGGGWGLVGVFFEEVLVVCMVVIFLECVVVKLFLDEGGGGMEWL